MNIKTLMRMSSYFLSTLPFFLFCITQKGCSVRGILWTFFQNIMSLEINALHAVAHRGQHFVRNSSEQI